MRAGFHTSFDLTFPVWRSVWSQSLVNEGRFPLNLIILWKVVLCVDVGVSQSLVNEGRFPLFLKNVVSIDKVMPCRNPSLMRAGFH